MLNKKLVLFISALIFSFFVSAQEIPQNLDKATLEKAVKAYKQVLSTEQNATVSLELAEVLYLLGKNEEAAQYYRNTIDKEGISPIHYKIYSIVLTNLGKTDSAALYENKFKKVEIEAKLLTRDLQMLTGFSHDTISFFVNKVSFNSQDADFSPVVLDSSIIFVSTRKNAGDVNIHPETGEPLYDLYKVEFLPEGEFTAAKKLSFQNMDHDVAEGPICFSPDGKQMYFSRNFLNAKNLDGKAAKLVDKLHIMYGDIEGNKISNIKDFEHNNYDFSVTQPYITRDGKDLFFVANHPEGNGGFDIFVSKMGYDGKWRKPENLGRTINTEEDELYPFLDANENLYFASSGHLSLGGLDIFVSHKTVDGWSEPVNLGTPFNSHYDDFGVYLRKDLKSGYFSSNRPGGMGSDDVYFFENIFDSPKERKEIMDLFVGKLNKDLFNTKKGVEIWGEVKDKTTGGPKEDVWVLLIDQFKNEVRQSVTDAEGKYKFKFVTPGNYLIIYEEKQSNTSSNFTIVPSDTTIVFSSKYIADNNLAKINIDEKKVGAKNILLGTFSASGINSFEGKDVFLVDEKGKIRNHSEVNSEGFYAFKNLKNIDYYILLKEKMEGVSTQIYLSNVDTNLRIKAAEIKSKDIEYDQSYPANAALVNTLIAGNVDSDISKKVLNEIPVFLVTTNLKSIRVSNTNPQGYFTFDKLIPKNYIIFNEASHRALISKRFVTLDHNLPAHKITQEQIKKFRSLRKKIDKNEKLVINGRVVDLKGTGLIGKKPLFLLDKSNNIIARAVSNSDGYFIFPNLAYDNSYKVIFESFEPNLTVTTSLTFIDMDLQEFYGKKGSYKYGELKGIKNEPTEININSKAFYNSNRQPAENVNFFLITEQGEIIKRLSTNKDGSFYFYKKQAGNYIIVQETVDTAITVTINSKRKSYSKLKSNIAIAGSNEYQLFNSVYFELGDFTLNEYAKNVLSSFQNYMKVNKIKKVIMNAYGDLTGSADKTLILTGKRAQSCKDFLDFKGIDPKKIETKGLGMTDQFKNENNEYDPALNRKVDILFLE